MCRWIKLKPLCNRCDARCSMDARWDARCFWKLCCQAFGENTSSKMHTKHNFSPNIQVSRNLEKKHEGNLKKSIQKNIAEVRALTQNPADRGPHGGAHGPPWVSHGHHGAPGRFSPKHAARARNIFRQSAHQLGAPGPPRRWRLNLTPGGPGAPGPPSVNLATTVGGPFWLLF